MWGYAELCAIRRSYVRFCGVRRVYVGCCGVMRGYVGLCEKPRRSGQTQRSSAVVSPHKGCGDRGNPQLASKHVDRVRMPSGYLSCHQTYLYLNLTKCKLKVNSR